MSAEPSLSASKTAHIRERVDLAHYETDKDPYEIDLARENQWCATSFTGIAPGVMRAALFYIPAVRPGELPPLPLRQHASLTNACRLGAMWYEARGPNLVSGIVRELTASWGQPSRSTRKEFSQSVYIRGSGDWKDVVGWRRGAASIWIGWTDWDNGNEVRRLLNSRISSGNSRTRRKLCLRGKRRGVLWPAFHRVQLTSAATANKLLLPNSSTQARQVRENVPAVQLISRAEALA